MLAFFTASGLTIEENMTVEGSRICVILRVNPNPRSSPNSYHVLAKIESGNKTAIAEECQPITKVRYKSKP